MATDKELAYAKETELIMVKAGFTGTYAGGARSKGNGFWLQDDLGNLLGYKNCRAIRKLVTSRKQHVN